MIMICTGPALEAGSYLKRMCNHWQDHEAVAKCLVSNLNLFSQSGLFKVSSWSLSFFIMSPYLARDWSPCKGFHFHSWLHLGWEVEGAYGLSFLGRYHDFLVTFSLYSLSSACRRGKTLFASLSYTLHTVILVSLADSSFPLHHPPLYLRTPGYIIDTLLVCTISRRTALMTS